MSTRERVAELLKLGLSGGEIARRLGLARSTVTYHCHRLGEVPDERYGRRFDWAEIQRFYDAGHSVRECQERFGFSRASWNEARRRGAVLARPQALPLEQLLVRGLPRGRHNLKSRLLSAGLKRNACESCGLSIWRGAPIGLALHHINGDATTTGSPTSSSCARTVTARRTRSACGTAAHRPRCRTARVADEQDRRGPPV